MQLEVVGGDVLKGNRLLKRSALDYGGPSSSLELHDETGEVQQIRSHVDDVVHDAVLALFHLRAAFSLLTLSAGVAVLTEALVRFDAYATIPARGFTLGYVKKQKEAEEKIQLFSCHVHFHTSSEMLLMLRHNIK